MFWLTGWCGAGGAEWDRFAVASASISIEWLIPAPKSKSYLLMVAIAFIKHSLESFITAIKFWQTSLSSFASFIKILSLYAAD